MRPTCPFRMATRLHSMDPADALCLEGDCAWWNSHQALCAILSLSNTLDTLTADIGRK